MRNKLTKFLTSEYPPLGNKGIFAKTWKYAACMLLAFVLGIGQMWAVDETISLIGATVKSATNKTAADFSAESSLSVGTGEQLTSLTVGRSAAENVIFSSYDNKSNTIGTSTTYYLVHPYNNGSKVKWSESGDNLFYADFVIPEGYTYTISSIDYGFATNSAAFSVIIGVKDITSTPSDKYTSSSIAVSSGGTAVSSISSLNVELTAGTHRLYVNPSTTANNTGKYWGMSKVTLHGEYASASSTPVAVTGIALAPSSATIKVGKTVTLVPTITPSNATDKAVTWAVTSGSSYASVTDAGVVSGLAVGTAVITATAHDGSGVTQTATVTVEECPTSGTIFSMNITASEGTAYSGSNTFPALIGATYVGGKAYSGSKTTTERTSTINGNGEYPFNAHSELAIKVVMDCPFEEGDIVTITNASNTQIKLQKVVGTDLHKTANKTFTIPSGSALIGEDVFYIMRDNQSSTLKSITVTRPLYRTITLEYADGTTADGSLEVIDGTAATKPTDPTWAHHRFDGWYNGATPYDWTANVTGDLTLTAHWTQLYTVTYEAGDGTATGDAPTEADKAATETFTVAANPFTVAGKDFVKWNDGTNDYAPGATYTVGTDNVVLTAQWKAAADKYTVIFKDGTTELGTKLFEVSTNPSDADIDKTKALSTFAAWQKEGVDIALDDDFWATVAKDAEITLTARWAKAYATSYDMEAYAVSDGASLATLLENLTAAGYAYTNVNGIDNGHTHNYIYDGMKYKTNDGDLSFNVNAGKLVIVKTGNLPANALTMYINGVADPTVFVGANEAVETHVNNYFYSAAEALYRLDIQASKGTCAIKAVTITDPYTVSFDVNGGDASIGDMNGTPSITLPTPTKGSESFLGWFDALDNKIGEGGESYTPTADIELVAHWEAVSTDTRISALTYTLGAAAPVDIYEADKNTFNIALPYAQAYDAITVAATPNHASASIKAGAELTVSSIPGTATFTIVAQSGAEENYTVNFTKGPKDGVEIIGAVVTGNTTANVTGVYKGTASVKLNDKKIDKGDYYIYVTLKDGQTLQNGDILVVDVNTKSGIGTQALEICTGEGNLNNGILTSIAVDDYSTGENTIVLASVPAGATSIGLKRSDNLNAKINGLKVYRPMNPILTAIQFNDTKVDVTGTTIAATLPNGTNLGAMTITPTIVWNGAGTAVAANTWEWSVANTYTVTDKDGDATVYTITLTEAIPAVDPTLTYNEGTYMVGASALDLSTLKDEADSDGEITYTVKDAGATGATITDGKFTATAAGTAIITATQAATLAYNAKTVDFNVVVTVATEMDGIKMVEAGALTGKFVTARTLSNGENTVEGIAYTKYLTMSSTMSSFGNEVAPSATKGIYYYPSHKNIRFYFYVYNNQSSAKKIYIYTVDEDAESTSDATSANVSVDAGRHLVYADVELTKHAAVVFGVENTGTQICQIVAVESGDELLQGGKAGYSIDYNKCYISPKAGTVAVYDGIEYKLYADAKLVSASNVQLQTLGTDYIKFHLDAPMTVNVYADNKKYYIGSECSTDAAAMLYEATGDGEFSLAAGDWYINGADVQVKINKLSFTAPKCAEPAIDAQPASKLDFAAGDMTASVTAHATDGGTLSYQWYKAADDSEVAGQTTETLTTTEEGTYYVIVTNTLADHSDNFVKSDNATLKYRKANDATLSSLTVSAGTLAPAFDPEVLEYNVTLSEGTVDVPTLTATAAMAAYGATADVTNAAAFVNYEATSTVLVTAEDHSTQQTYTVHFYVEHTILALVDVTGDMTWDFSKDGLADKATVGTEVIMANVAGVVNDANFKSDNIKVTANKQAGTKLQASMIMFHSTVDGLIKVVFSNTGDKSSERYLVVNGKKTDSGTKTKTNITYYGFVPAGDVVLTVIEGDGNMLNFASVQFTAKAAADLARDAAHGDDWMAPGELGTVCIPNGAVATGGDLYELVGKNEVGKIVFATVPNNKMTPGVPYLFQATSNAMNFFYTDEATVAAPDNSGAMKGTFGDQNLTDLENVYYFAGHALWGCSDLTSLNVKANRAWVVLDDNVSTISTSNPAPGRRYITMEAHGQNAATGIGNVQGDEVQSTKVLINGQLFILRGEKMYDATGRMVK